MIFLQNSFRFFLGFFLLLISLESFASLIISPTRVIFDGRDRAQTVTLINSSNEVQTYRVSFVEKQQEEINGLYKTIENEDEIAKVPTIASNMLRFSPRQVTLNPGEKQSVRISLRKPANLPDGEYRSHMSFTIIPKAEQVELATKNAGFKFFMLPSFTIPVQVRNGVVEVRSTIDSTKIEKISADKWGVATMLSKQGNYGAFGVVKVYWKPNAIATYKQVGVMNNVALYREVKQRLIMVTLDNEPKAGLYKVEFLADKSFNQKVFDVKEFAL